MDYFQLFGLPVTLTPDARLVKQRYFELSKQSHPDYFVNESEEEQQTALESSALLNKALKTLSNRDATIRYVLTQKGLLEEEEKYTLPPSFLMQMLEVNEEAAEAKMDGDPERLALLNRQLSDIENEIYEPVEAIIENYSETAGSEKELLQVKDYYFKKKYLLRLREQLAGMA